LIFSACPGHIYHPDEFFIGLDQKQKEISCFQGGIDVIHHSSVHQMQRLMNSGIINKNDLATVGSLNAQQTDSGCLRLIRDDGNFLADQGIKQSRFTTIGPSNQSYITGSILAFFSFFLAGMLISPPVRFHLVILRGFWSASLF